MKRKLKNVTLVAVATTEVEATVSALKYSIRGLDFQEVLLVSHYDPSPDLEIYRHVEIKPFSSVKDWGEFVVFDLHRHISTSHIVLVHADGFVINPEKWSDDFLKYDYIGAPWPLPSDNVSFRDYYGNIVRMGNSVSLRSLRILQLPEKLGLDWGSAHQSLFHEDGFLCVQSRHILQKHGIEYAPFSVALNFSREKTLPENKDILPFAFHQWSGQNRKYPCFGKRKDLFYKIKRSVKALFNSYAKNH